MKKSNKLYWIIVGLLCCGLIVPVTMLHADEYTLPEMPPTIEELTEGKVKIGDVITKDNVDLVKDYLSLGMYECVKNGMVLRMGENIPLDQLNPDYYLAATEKYKGQAEIDDHGVVHLENGAPWPGGMPFTEPKTGMEVMGYARFGHAYDDHDVYNPNLYVNKHGKLYKTGIMKSIQVFCDGRTKTAPLGMYPGMEKFHFRNLVVFTSPLDLKGLGQLGINHIDDTANYDIGFAYLPAFKRTIRVSASTYQDNLGGSDFTYGDPNGLREPFGSWNFKLLEKRYMLVGEPVSTEQNSMEDGGLTVNANIEWDLDRKFPRLGWAISPVYVVEATPKEKGHVYSKKLLYVLAPYFCSAHDEESTLVDIYDRAGSLWKTYYSWRGAIHTQPDGTKLTSTKGMTMHDLQSGHQTHMLLYPLSVSSGLKAEDMSLKKLMELGK